MTADPAGKAINRPSPLIGQQIDPPAADPATATATDGSEPATAPATAADAGLTYRQRLFIEVSYPDGRPFFEGEVQLTTYGLSRVGVVGLNLCAVEWLKAQADLGRYSAERHGEVVPDVIVPGT